MSGTAISALQSFGVENKDLDTTDLTWHEATEQRSKWHNHTAA